MVLGKDHKLIYNWLHEKPVSKAVVQIAAPIAAKNARALLKELPTTALKHELVTGKRTYHFSSARTLDGNDITDIVVWLVYKLQLTDDQARTLISFLIEDFKIDCDQKALPRFAHQFNIEEDNSSVCKYVRNLIYQARHGQYDARMCGLSQNAYLAVIKSVVNTTDVDACPKEQLAKDVGCNERTVHVVPKCSMSTQEVAAVIAYYQSVIVCDGQAFLRLVDYVLEDLRIKRNKYEL